MMEQAPGLNIREAGVVDAAYVTASFDSAKAYLKTRVSYVFEKERSNPDMWEISTWSRKVRRSSILKDGTDADKANLPVDTSHRSKPRQQRGRKKSLSDRRRVRRRVDAPPPPQSPPPPPPPSPPQAYQANELPDLRGQHTARTRAREEEIEQQVGSDMVEEQRLSRLESARIG